MIIKEQDNKIVYSDGEVTESRMLDIAKNYPEDASQDYIASSSSYTLNNTFSAVRQNILNWYPFKEHASILEVGAGMGAVTGLLCEKADYVTAIEMSEARADVIRARYQNRKNLKVISENINDWNTNEKFDYVVFIGVLEYAAVFSDNKRPYDEFLLSIKRLMKDDGVLLFAIENRFGLKYWLGGSEDHLQEPFVGIAGYQKGTPRTFSRKELEVILERVGFINHRFYSVLPDYKFPELIFSDEYTPNYMNLKKVSFTYSKNSSLIADERELYKDIIENETFPFFANSFLIEASTDNLEEKHVVHVSAKGEVYKEFRVSTVMDNTGCVYKMPMHKAAETHIHNILANTKYLLERGVEILPVELKGNVLCSQKYTGISAQDVFAKALANDDKALLLEMIEQLRISLLKSSDAVEYNINNIIEKNNLGSSNNIDYGVILQKAFVDMTFYNAFWVNGRLVFFDQEWCFERVPLKFCLYYSIKSAYLKADEDTKITLDELLEYIDVQGAQIEVYNKLEEFIWSNILYRQTDFYGKEGYCNRYSQTITLQAQRDTIREKQSQIESLLESEQKLTQTICNKEGHIELLLESERKLEREKTELIQEKAELEQTIRNKEGHIELLLEVEREYEREKNTRGYRFILNCRKIPNILFPMNSRRRFLLSMCAKLVRNPKFMLRVINPRRIINFFKVYKEEGMAGVWYQYEMVEKVETSQLNPLEANQIEVEQVNTDIPKSIEDYEKLTFTQYDNPDVSIVIPVYNQFEYTYNCLDSILKNSGDVHYEVIIANDCSTDLTTQLGDVADGITIITNEKNLRFLLNCNNAAKYAKGKYIVFLNNDTQVQKDWLRPLVDILEKDPTVGMTGSKLVYANGWLQEAGGIFWDDASAWNYGNKQNPEDPEYNYVKEVDYISGASIMIRASLWQEIGGFDERFVPAYYEDSDLAFEVRKHGYKVVYQPLSVVVHFEGISNGTDVTTGQKSYQVINQKKFYEKWKEVLEKEHFPNAENVFLAKDRSRFKKHILVVDHYVPHYDKDAGGKCTYMYLLMFVKMGFKVTFIGDNFFKHEPYTTELNQYGIEVLYGNYYYNNWQEWLKNNLHYFDYVYLQRPHISIKYIDIIKKYGHAKILYFAHDLHHIREYREYELTGDPEKLKSSEHWKEIEYELFSKVDVGHVVGNYEQEIMQKAFPDKPIRNIPLYIYDNILSDINKNFAERKDLIYVGGFGHGPNIDAVLWFGKEVFPKVLEKYPDMKWHVVGSKAPKEVEDLASENILIDGFLSDEELHALYRSCRMSVVPLRVGAGVKGKVVEAAYYQIPLVTTSIGGEGLDTTLGNMILEDDADKMASVICDLYEDYDRLKIMSDAGVNFISKYFTEQEAERVLRQDISIDEM